MAVHDEIEAAAEAAIEAAIPAVSVTVAKSPLLPTGAALPHIRLCVEAPGEFEDLRTDKTLAGYPLVVAIYQATNSLTDQTTTQDWATKIGQALNDRDVFAAVPGINEVRRNDLTLFDRAAMMKLHNAAFLRFTVEVIEDTHS